MKQSLGIAHFLKAIDRYEAAQRAYLLFRLITLLQIQQLRVDLAERERVASMLEKHFLDCYTRVKNFQSQRFH